jgi:iron complex transport system substrate-binding protein
MIGANAIPPNVGRRAALLLPLAAALSGRAHAQPLEIADVRGQTIQLKGQPQRIVLGFNFEEFTAVAGPAGWDRVVGYARSQWSNNRAVAFARYAKAIPRLADLPDIGNNESGNFSVETILSLRPDVVILPEVWLAPLKDQIARIEAASVPIVVIDYNAQLPERHVTSTLAFGVITGQRDRAAELADLYMSRLADLHRRLAGVTAKSKVYVEIGQGGAGSTGNTYWKSMWGRIIDLIGAQNIAEGRIAGGWGPVSPEYVISANPDAIFIAGSSWVNRPEAVLTGYGVELATTRARLAPYARRPGWPELAAIRSGELHALEHGLCRSLYDYTAILYIAKQLHPQHLADIDPVAELRRYHERYLPVAFDGTWMARLT